MTKRSPASAPLGLVEEGMVAAPAQRRQRAARDRRRLLREPFGGLGSLFNQTAAEIEQTRAIRAKKKKKRKPLMSGTRSTNSPPWVYSKGLFPRSTLSSRCCRLERCTEADGRGRCRNAEFRSVTIRELQRLRGQPRSNALEIRIVGTSCADMQSRSLPNPEFFWKRVFLGLH